MQKSPELQNILAERLQIEGSMPYVIYLPNCKFYNSLMNTSTFYFVPSSKIRFTFDDAAVLARCSRHESELELKAVSTQIWSSVWRIAALLAEAWSQLSRRRIKCYTKLFFKAAQARKNEMKNHHRKKFINGWEFLLISRFFSLLHSSVLVKFFNHDT